MGRTRDRAPCAAALFVVLVAAYAGCSTPCAPSSAVQVSLQGDARALAGVTSLTIGISIGAASPQQVTRSVANLRSGQTLLLSPSMAPASSSYELTVFVQAFDSAGALVSMGSVGPASVGASACNELTLPLASTATGADLAATDLDAMPVHDLAGDGPPRGDMGITGDLLPCNATTPDEDADGRGDACDVCAANFETTFTDQDSDGLPDSCDPAPTTAGNKRLYFEPFNATPTGWTGPTTVSGGNFALNGASACGALGTASGTMLPDSVQVQTYVTPSVLNVAAAADVEARLFLWATIPATASAGGNGLACVLQATSGGQYFLIAAAGAVNGDPNSAGGGSRGATAITASDFAVGVTRRLRLTVHGTAVTCEMADSMGNSPVTVGLTLTAAPTGALFGGVGSCYTSTNFGSLFAASDP